MQGFPEPHSYLHFAQIQGSYHGGPISFDDYDAHNKGRTLHDFVTLDQSKVSHLTCKLELYQPVLTWMSCDGLLLQGELFAATFNEKHGS